MLNHAPENAIGAFCMGLHARGDRITADGSPLPIEGMIRGTPEGPLDVPLYPVAEQCWRELRYLD
jgi:hypothetical protein